MIRIYILGALVTVSLILIFSWGFDTLKNSMQNTYAPKNPPSKVSQKKSIPEKLIIKGSIPYWDQDSAFSSFQNNISTFNFINLFWYYVGSNGEVVKYGYANEDSTLISLSHEHNVKVSAVIANLPEGSDAQWDEAGLVENVISENNRRAENIQAILDKLNELNFDGAIIDYEQVSSSSKNDFTRFIQELSTALHNDNKFLSVVLHPKIGENKQDEKGGFQDWKKLAEYADQLQIMGYEEHWEKGNAGPIAGIGWIERILKYEKILNIPSSKIFFGIALYGYDWNVTDGGKAVGLTFLDVENLLSELNAQAKWDEKSKSPYFVYTESDGDKHEVWFENAESVSAKIDLARSYGLSQFTFWRLGGEDPQIWEVLKKYK